MSEERRRAKEADDIWTTSKKGRECPVPKPGGLIGQVLGVKRKEVDEAKEAPSVTKQVGRIRRETQSQDSGPS
jgi:cytochrome c oxidase assembly factor 2